MEFVQVDVFADSVYQGNSVAVFMDAAELTEMQMQTIAREMNLSETTFVQEVSDGSYRLRIFTPATELPFAGHPTLGTAWTLRDRGLLTDDEVTQTSPAGETRVTFEGEKVWFERPGRVNPDLADTSIDAIQKVAEAVGLEPEDIGLEARELGRSGRLTPAVADAGVDQLMVPVRDLKALARARGYGDKLDRFTSVGAYCFTAQGAGRIRARGLFPSAGIEEDPATGSAAAGLGFYLADRVGPVDMEIHQGVEMGRPSRIAMSCDGRTARVGGACLEVLTGRLSCLP